MLKTKQNVVEQQRIRIIGQHLYVQRSSGVWQEDLVGLPGETDEDLYQRWLNLCAEKEVEERLLTENQRINNIISIVVPIIFIALILFLSAFVK